MKKKKPNSDCHQEWTWKNPNFKPDSIPKEQVHPLPKGSKVYWTKEDCEELSSIPELASAIAYVHRAAVEKVICKVVEEIEGGTPTPHDATVFGRRNIYPDGLEIWTWRGLPIVTVERLENFVIKISELEWAQ